MSSIPFAISELKKLGAKDFEVYFQKASTLKIEARNGSVESLTQAIDSGLSVRVLRDQRPGFSYTTSLEPAAIAAAVKNAWEIAAYLPPDTDLALARFAGQTYPSASLQSSLYDAAGLARSTDEKIQMALALESACRQADKRITAVRTAAVSQSEFEIELADSTGQILSRKSTAFSASVMCKAESGGETQSGGEYGVTRLLSELDIGAVGRDGARYAAELLGAKQAPTLKCPAVLRNTVVLELIDFLSSSFSAEAIFKGMSLLKGKLGERLFSSNITLVDDGLKEGALGTAPFDAEGTPQSRTVLVDRGRIAHWLADLKYARKLGISATGNASRSVKSPPGISTTNLILEGGSTPFEGLVEKANQGILITDLMGLHTANSVTGDFSLGASGFLIEGGKLTRPVRGFAVSGNILELLARVEDVGSDTKVSGSTYAPSLLIQSLSIGGNE